MFKFLSKLFNKNKIKDSSIDSSHNSETLSYNLITFSVDQWDRIRIDVLIQNQHSHYAELFGKLLYNINNGSYEDQILASLVELSKSNKTLVSPIQEALTAWSIMIINKPTEDNKEQSAPLIKPTAVFNK